MPDLPPRIPRAAAALVLAVLLCGLGPPALARPVPLEAFRGSAVRAPAPSLPHPFDPQRVVVDAKGAWPLSPQPRVVQGFDPPASRWGPGHRGVDLLGHPGQRVRSAQTGRVSFTGTIAGRGVVVVDHGDTRTTYEPVTATVSVGDTVSAGRPIGRLQAGGSHCFPRSCLHWGLIEGAEAYLDPLTLVGLGPVRLLPLTG